MFPYKDAYNMYKEITDTIDRKGIKDFTEWLFNKTSFPSEPMANKEGGLLIHSIDVYSTLCQIAHGIYLFDTLRIVALFHDIAKAFTYCDEIKYNQELAEQIPCFGCMYGNLSAYILLLHGVELRTEEIVAISCHNCTFTASTYHADCKAFDKYPLTAYLHSADVIATHINNRL